MSRDCLAGFLIALTSLHAGCSCGDDGDDGDMEGPLCETPLVMSVEPVEVCDSGGTITVRGTGFEEAAEILIDGAAIPTTFVSATEVTGTVGAGLSAEPHDVTVSNGPECVAEPLVGAFTGVAAPQVFFVDPPTIYSEIDMRVTVYASGIRGDSPTVQFRPTGGTNTFDLEDPTFDGDNRIFGTVTASMDLAAGDFDVIVNDGGCIGELTAATAVTDTLSVYVSDIDPGFGVSSIDPAELAVDNTGVAVFSDLATTPGGQANFAQTPRIYLNPISSSGAAAELRAVQWLDDPGRVNGVVPTELAAGDYQVLVINPDGGVGLLDAKPFTVLPNDDPPPLITALDPGQVVDGAARTVDIIGDHFPTVIADIELTATCRDPRAVDPAATEVALSGTVDAAAATRIDSTWDVTGLNGFACVIRVANLANNSFTDFSALSVVDASGNLADFFDSGRSLNTARRAHAGAAVRMNASSRFLFAIGGDDGAATPTRFASVESAPLDAFGTISADFTFQRNELPAERAFTSGAAAVVGRYIYMAGGRAGGADGAVDGSVLRAYLLDPFESAEIRDLDFDLVEDSTGVAAGLWHYRVAAVLSDGSVVAADPNNPGGEGLASDPFAVRVPEADTPVDVTVIWNHVPNAVAYRVYRTTAPGEPAGTELLLGAVDTELDQGVPLDLQSFTDTGIDNSGLDPADPANTPMPLGSLGVWHEVATLATAREGAAIVAVPDYECVPDCVDPTGFVPDLTRSFLYVIGGRDDQGNVLDSIEHAVIDAPASNEQNVLDPTDMNQSGFAISGEVLPELLGKGARWLLGAVYMDGQRSTEIAEPEVFLYALNGEDGEVGNNAVNLVTAIAVDTSDDADDGDGTDGNGSLTGAINVAAPAAKFTGYGYVSGNNFLHMIGGRTGAPSSTGDESFVLAVEPALDPWDAGTTLTTARQLHATAHESAFVFQIGGATDAAEASASIEQSNF